MLQEQLRVRSTRREFVDSARGSVGHVKSLIRADREVVAGRVVTWQIPAHFLRTRGKVEPSQGGVSLYRCGPWHGCELACPQRIGRGVGQHAKEERSRALVARIDKLLDRGRIRADLVDKGRAGAADDQ